MSIRPWTLSGTLPQGCALRKAGRTGHNRPSGKPRVDVASDRVGAAPRTIWNDDANRSAPRMLRGAHAKRGIALCFPPVASVEGSAAVHGKRCAGHEGRLGAGQEEDDLSLLLRPAHATQNIHPADLSVI